MTDIPFFVYGVILFSWAYLLSYLWGRVMIRLVADGRSLLSCGDWELTS